MVTKIEFSFKGENYIFFYIFYKFNVNLLFILGYIYVADNALFKYSNS